MPQLVFSEMSKAYAGTPALTDVTLALQTGRIHALMGENGAGKSTLIKLIAGVVPADKLAVSVNDVSVPLRSPHDAYKAGFRFIHQELNIVPQISVAENILLGHRFPRRLGIAVNWRKLNDQARQSLHTLGAQHIDVQTPAGELTAGDRMLVKIAAALVAQPGEDAILYVLDEPTAALNDKESSMLLAVIERLKLQGAAVLYISHRMDEVMRLCDDVTVLRDGRHISTQPIEAISRDTLIQQMTGRDVKEAYPQRTVDKSNTVVAVVDNVCSSHLSKINFELRAGEILGVSGLSDAGQSELLKLFMGIERVKSGRFAFIGQGQPASTHDAWRRKIAYIPRERRRESLMLGMPVRSNILLPHLGSYGIKANKAKETRDTAELAEKVNLKYRNLEQAVGELSGGNQQKVVFARTLHDRPALLLLDEPTRGVDVGAKYDIYELVRQLSAQGCAIILSSTDLPEILGMCDRILVLHDGRQAHLLERGSLSSAELLGHFHAAHSAGHDSIPA